MATKISMVKCRYPKCLKLHESNELNKVDAVKGDGKSNSYYHPDCYHTMQTVNEIRDLFYKEIDPTLTQKQVGMLVSTIHNIIFEKKVDVDYLKFVLQYFIKNKPGALKHPAGLHYIIQDRDASVAWEKVNQQKIRAELKRQMQEAVDQLGEILGEEVELDFGTDDSKFVYKPQNKSRFSNVLGV